MRTLTSIRSLPPGWATVRQGKGLKERRVPLSLQARKALDAYLVVRPETNTPALFLTKN